MAAEHTAETPLLERMTVPEVFQATSSDDEPHVPFLTQLATFPPRGYTLAI
jgi:hypothetical protein